MRERFECPTNSYIFRSKLFGVNSWIPQMTRQWIPGCWSDCKFVEWQLIFWHKSGGPELAGQSVTCQRSCGLSTDRTFKSRRPVLRSADYWPARLSATLMDTTAAPVLRAYAACWKSHPLQSHGHGVAVGICGGVSVCVCMSASLTVGR